MTKAKKQSNTKASNPYNPKRSTPAPIVAAKNKVDSGWVNIVTTSGCLVDDMFFTHITCKGEGAYVAPQKKFIKTSPLEAVEKFNIHGVFDRVENNIPLTVSPTRSYTWDCFATYGNGDDTAESIGAHITKEFNVFAKENSHEFKFPQKYRFRNGAPPIDANTTSTRHPVNHFISNEDTLVVMKSMLSEGNAHADVAASAAVLESFFGTDPDGLSLFHELSEDEWKE